MPETMLELKNLKKYFYLKRGALRREAGVVKAIDGISFSVEKGRNFALVGESGSGKTTVGRNIVRLYRPTEGEIWFNGEEISKAKGRKLKEIRRKMQMVFQDPASSLNPRRNVRSIVSTPLDIHGIGTRGDRLKRVKELLNDVELSEDYMYRRPTVLSGGEKQRVAMARALASNPILIILDEPTSSLDVSVQAKILTLLEELQKKLDLTYLLITHELSVVRNFTQDTAVMYLGKILERSTTNEIFNNPLHPYTKTLLSSLPVVFDEELALLPKTTPLPDASTRQLFSAAGCRFYTRCPECLGEKCAAEEPPLTEVAKGHFVACHKCL